jgi:hypothetical protein
VPHQHPLGQSPPLRIGQVCLMSHPHRPRNNSSSRQRQMESILPSFDPRLLNPSFQDKRYVVSYCRQVKRCIVPFYRYLPLCSRYISLYSIHNKNNNNNNKQVDNNSTLEYDAETNNYQWALNEAGDASCSICLENYGASCWCIVLYCVPVCGSTFIYIQSISPRCCTPFFSWHYMMMMMMMMITSLYIHFTTHTSLLYTYTYTFKNLAMSQHRHNVDMSFIEPASWGGY